MNQITLQAAQKFESKLLSCPVPLAVFSIYGGWSVTKVTTESFKNQVRLNPERLVGVYTADAKLEDLIDDFFAAGIR